jgi:HK97 family phage prohead protease
VSAEDAKRLNGYAIVFNSLSVDLGGFREIISPDAVDRALKEGTDVRALVDHDSAKILGRVRAGTLGLRKDTTGLRVSIEPDTQISYAADIMRSVARGDVSGMSFGFRTLADEWNYEGKIPIRTVTDMKLSEVSIVTFPAYEKTDVNVALRSLEAFRRETFGSSQSLEMRRRWHKTQLAK